MWSEPLREMQEEKYLCHGNWIVNKKPRIKVRLVMFSQRIFAGVTLVCFCLCGFALAQTAPKPAPKIIHIQRSLSDETAQDLANEYSDILERLHDVITDYSEYLKEVGDNDLTTTASFKNFNDAFKNGAYADDQNKLSHDLTTYLDKLATLDKDCAQPGTHRSAKACRVLHSLKREMSSVSEELSAHRANLSASRASDEEMQKAFKQVMILSKEIAAQCAEVARQAVEKAGDELQRVELTVPNAPQAGDAPTPPSTRSVVRIKRIRPVDHSHEAGTQRNSNGVITVTLTALPVHIINPNGSIEIAGGSGKSIEASLEIEVAAGSRAREKELADAIGLNLSGGSDGYRVEITVPRLSDPQTKILTNALVVSVPSNLRLICTNAYGDLTVSGMTNQVTATSSYSSMDISDCDGGVTAVNSMGSISLSNITGQISITDSYAPIEVTDCNGDITITNAYSSVDLSNSHGKVVIQNTGQVSVSEHVGPVSISNQYGEVTVTNIRGNLDVQNAYQQVSVEKVIGQARIENSYSPIKVSAISGRIKLINRFAAISGEDMRGPFDIVSQNGAIDLELAAQLKGMSSINSTYGSVQIGVTEPINLYIDARTTFADISSSLPMKMTSEGSTRSGVLRLGTGRDSLSIIGTNAAIKISGGR
jgi:DUF4097 and DUF4098 domain-containing protein YvlB